MTIGADRADAWIQEAFIYAVVSEDFALALARRQAELLAEDVTAQDLDDWRAEMVDIEAVLPTRFGTPDMRRRHEELNQMVRKATAQLMARPDLVQLQGLPRAEEQLRVTWGRWDLATTREWIRRLVHRVEVRPAVSRSRASSVESRLSPIWRV